MAKYIHKYKNLIVLRTFSKALGLAGIRLGYLMCSNEDIIEALLLHRQHFPITQLSLNIAHISTKDMNFVRATQNNTNKRRDILFKNLDTLSTFQYVPSLTNIFMLKNKRLSSNDLDKKFRKRGIITSQLNVSEVFQNDYLRVTLRKEEDNLYLFETCKEIEKECMQNS